MVRKNLRFNFMLDSQMSELIKEAELATHYLIGYDLHLCKLMKTHLHYFTVNILTQTLFCNSLDFKMSAERKAASL